ncbi:RsmB [Desulfamplus magnetovallimortis]|uniref:16S rRNA (cytosine(967)-C(5))-methyltransferase n=1 Tax=Desulfamplus magnetovallimortis TaxID=1246637 RepID=A0A1W1HJ57_9BACT|nr:16S rRNA (cytosine(967)-C(5))-methyltransferase RsmB [Desulfamplus magnetovallimortis]SLM32483.1 RsmB [Desulfamplus magnetovallimortis]
MDTSCDPRQTAIAVLIENSRTRRPLDAVIEQFSSLMDTLSRRDRSLANALIYGTLRWQNYLDWLIQPFSDRDITTLKPDIIYIMRMAMFQVVFMDRIPVSAAVNTAVDAAKRQSHKGTAGFVNAVLRKATEQYNTVALPDQEKKPELYLSISASMPITLVRKWISRFGFDKTDLLCRTINEIPPITIRTNTLKINREELIYNFSNDVEHIAPTSFSSVGISFTRPAKAIHETDSFKSGFFQVQDEAAQLVTEILSPQPGERILDACAGLGGKTGHTAQLMQNRGTVIAADTDAAKLERLAQEMDRLGITIVKTCNIDLLKALPADFQGELFDRVLVDAPCSGLGVLRKNPDSKWKLTKKDMARLAIRQQKMLLSAANLVKPSGLLLYAVCSCEVRENEDVVEWFLDQRRDFRVKNHFPTLDAALKNKSVSDRGFFRTYPDNLDMDGFFAVLFENFS